MCVHDTLNTRQTPALVFRMLRTFSTTCCFTGDKVHIEQIRDLTLLALCVGENHFCARPSPTVACWGGVANMVFLRFRRIRASGGGRFFAPRTGWR